MMGDSKRMNGPDAMLIWVQGVGEGCWHILHLDSCCTGPTQDVEEPVDVEVLLHIVGRAIVHPPTSKMLDTLCVFSKY